VDERADEPRLLAVAASIADHATIDWTDLHGQFANTSDSSVIDELRIVQEIARVHSGGLPEVRQSDAESDTTGEHPAASPGEDPVHAPAAWGRFSLVREIGRGAFGVVYEAVDPALQRAVALKLIRPRPPGAVNLARALDEARLLARIRHPNVVTVYGAERTDDEVALWMDLIRGHTLHELVDRGGPLGAREGALIGLDLCRALAAIHGAGLVHGDLKAHNVMREEGGRIVLMDFGAGKDVSSREHRAHDFVGTPVYVAPEVFEGRQRTPASDIYSLGVLLFYLVTGRYPIEGRTLSQVEAQHRHGTQRRLRDVRPDLPEPFVGVVQRALAREPEGRQQSAGELETALLQTLAGTGASPSRQWFKSPPAIAAMLIVAMLGGAAVLALLRMLDDTDARQPSAAARAATAIPAASSPRVDAQYRVQAGLYRVQDERRVRLRSNDRVSPGDRLSLDIEVSQPAHVYVVNEDDAGDAYLLFPLPGQTLENPIPPGHQHHLPGIVNGREMYWQVTSAGGREHLLVFVSPDEVPVFSQLATRLARPTPGKPVTEARVPRSAGAAVLRGIGGLAAAPPPATGLDRLSARFTVPLPDSEETTSGLWVRQITFENPGK
jgi:hypothetical protein